MKKEHKRRINGIYAPSVFYVSSYDLFMDVLTDGS